MNNIKEATTVFEVERFYIQRVESLQLARVMAELREVRQQAQSTVDLVDKVLEKVTLDVAEQRDGAFTAAIQQVQAIAEEARRLG